MIFAANQPILSWAGIGAFLVVATLSEAASPWPTVPCEPWDADAALKRAPGKLYGDVDRPVPEHLWFPFDIVGWGPDGREVNTVRKSPHVVIDLGDGWLLGADHGEWGGALVHRSDGVDTTVIDDNIEDIYPWGDFYVVTSGLAHLTSNSGRIYLLHEPEPDHFEASVLHALPGQPAQSWLMATGDLYIEVTHAGDFILTRDYALRRVVCDWERG